jgi:hypothetical protein
MFDAPSKAAAAATILLGSRDTYFRLCEMHSVTSAAAILLTGQQVTTNKRLLYLSITFPSDTRADHPTAVDARAFIRHYGEFFRFGHMFLQAAIVIASLNASSIFVTALGDR